MIRWRIHKDTGDTSLPVTRLKRRMDVTVAIKFLKGKRLMLNGATYISQEENESMFVHNGQIGRYCKLKEYMNLLEIL
jgi:hypothetical protein